MKIAVMVGRRNIKELEKIFSRDIEIAFFIDNNIKSLGAMIGDKKVFSPYEFSGDMVEYVVILIYAYEGVNQELTDLGFDQERIINLCDPTIDLYGYRDIFDVDAADRFRLKLRMDHMETRIRWMELSRQHFEENYLYEAADILKRRQIELPRIVSVECTCERIISEKCSMSRYGDGEFEIILGKAKDIYQSDNAKLAERLREILTSDVQNHIVALADDYGAMEGIRKENKETIRKYMTEEKRKQHYALLDMNKTYYNAYISRPYVIYPHDEIEKARKRFDDLKRIWDQREVLLVEGDRTRMGIGNDLFANAESVERIIAPNENAFDVYDAVYDAVMEEGENKVILIALGPTATVLAYDLAKAGYWALDIGHLDLEYEWFLRGKGYSYVPHKYNNEMPGDTMVTDISDQGYEQSIGKIISATR